VNYVTLLLVLLYQVKQYQRTVINYWLSRDEMNVTLNDARSALEVAIEMQQDDHLKLVQSLMHSAAGALHVIELNATAKLANEIETTVTQLLEGRARNRDESLEAITAGVVMLPKFFSKTLDNDNVENAVALLPVLKGLRDARGGGDFSDQTLKVMSLDPVSVAEKDRSAQSIKLNRTKSKHDLQALIGKLRPVFQASLLGWIKGGDTQGHLQRLATITEKFEQAAKEERAFKLWWVTGGIVEALQENGLKTDADLRRLLGQVDRAGKLILDEGELAYQHMSDSDLLNELVRVIQRITTNGEKVKRIRQGFGLHENLDDAGLMSVAQSAMAAPDSQVMTSLSAAINEDLEQVKDALDIFNRTGSKENLELEKRFSSLKKIADTLGMLGLEDLQQRLINQEKTLGDLVSSNQKITDDHLIPIAASLLQVETRLEEELSKMSGRTEDNEKPKYLKDALAANFREIKTNLARVKECIAEFMQNPMDIKSISRSPAYLKESQAASQMAEKDRLAEVFRRLQEYIMRQLIGSGRLPYPEHLELLAGAIESADFYLETLSKGRRDPWYMLENAETCLDQLAISAPEPLHDAHRGGGTQIMPSVSTNVDIDGNDTAILEADLPIPRNGPKNSTVITPTLTIKAKPAHPDSYPVMDSSVDTDPEVIELFIEECKEVNESLKEEFSEWLSDRSNENSLTTVRRGFHTLKGSGRMVGAKRLGEFAWHAEVLVNRVLDNTIVIDDVGVDLLTRAVNAVPSLIEQLESGADTNIDVHALMLSLENYTQSKLAHEDEDETLTKLPGDIDNPNARFTDTKHFGSVDDFVNSDQESSVESTAEIESGIDSEFIVLDSTREVQSLSDNNLHADIDLAASHLSGNNNESTAEFAPHTQIMDMRKIHNLEDSQEAAVPHTQIIDMREHNKNMLVDIDSEDVSSDAKAPNVDLDFSSALDSVKDDALLNLDEYTSQSESKQTDISASVDEVLELTAAQREALAGTIPSASNEAVAQIDSNEIINADLLEDEIDVNNIYNLDETLNQILQAETQNHLNVIRNFAKTSIGLPVNSELHRAVHTLHGSVHMAEINPMVELASAFEASIQKLYDQGLPIEAETAGLMLKAAGELEAMVDTVNQDVPMPLPTPQLLNEFHALRSAVVTRIFDPEFINDVLGNDFEPMDADIPNSIEDTNYGEAQLINDSEILSQLDEIDREIDELSVETAQLNSDIDIDQPIDLDIAEKPIESNEQVTPPTTDSSELLDVDEDILEIFLEEAKDIIAVTDASVATWDKDGISESNLQDMQRYLHTIKGGARMAGLMSFGDFTHDMESYVLGIQHKTIEQNDTSRRLLQKAVDELHHILEDVEARREPKPSQTILDSMLAAQNLIDDADQDEIDDLNHHDDILQAAEQSLAEHVDLTDSLDLPMPSDETLNNIETNIDDHHDPLMGSANDTESVLAELSNELESLTAELADTDLVSAPKSDADQKESTDEPSIVDIFDYKVTEVASRQSQARQQDAARISTNNLETLLNQAGEVSIYRSRIEQEVSNATLNLSELARTVMRVREQLRNMEIETEAQILHQFKDEITNDDFDPLEMDRYSNIQQLSRALAESVNDLQSLDTLLGNQLRETEALLLQQSRVVTDLQDGLMRVRMIPFARYAPRYARIVRQVSNEVGKEVELEVVGAESEIDRQVIERMQGPLEHMIRNAVIHGVESPDVRRASGKNPEGQIKLTLSREGVNLLMTLEDDGSGLELSRIRKKALELELIDESQELTDNDLAQLILVSGFSTAQKVTQNAGRGVGMDVVANEIKQLGGSLHITTVNGKGTKFNMRLPFTRAINHALMVRAGDESYAVPLHKIDGIVTISLPALQRLLESESPVYRYGEFEYDVKALTEMVGMAKSHFESDENTVNLVLVSGGDHRAALAVHELFGNREMVIKPVGPQIAGVRGISGATILGDGRIVVILDIDALLGAQLQDVSEAIVPVTQVTLPLIMVVDDSITVRRVTERLLERNQMQVVTARDGMNALTLLQEHKPDIILMDIEMPRMDGYELAEHVRTDEETKDIPIIMITSRTGDKHRARAIEIGVNDYLGKPYREDQLLEALKPYLQPDEVA